MKIDLFDMDEFIKLNHLQEVTNPILFEHGDSPSRDGLISNEIFGISNASRKETFAYINLVKHYFHPHAYRILHDIFKKIDGVIAGTIYVSIGTDHTLVEDPEHGETGIDFLYNNWETIEWTRTGSDTRDDIIDLLKKRPKNHIFMHNMIVIPAFYRDIKRRSSGGNETDDLNTLYSRLIRYANVTKNQSLFAFQSYNNDYQIQRTLFEIYSYFSNRLKGKMGIFRRYLMGKTVDYCSRTVITAPTYHANTPNDLSVSFKHSLVPISQASVLMYPFVYKYIRDFFERELYDNKFSQIIFDPKLNQVVDEVEIADPSYYISEEYIKRIIDTYKIDPSSRFKKITVKGVNGRTYELRFTGHRCFTDGRQIEELGALISRPMTWTDILYMACVDSVKDKHMITTRYPILDEYGTFVTVPRISSTIKTEPMMVNGEFYPNYPVINFDTSPDEIGIQFIDSVQFSNSYLKGIAGDYDGDQCTCKILFSQEANAELENYIYKKENFIDSYGKCIRVVSKELSQTYYVLTKEPDKSSKVISASDKAFLLSTKPEDITFEWIVDNFGDTGSITEEGKTKAKRSKFKSNDIVQLSPGEYPLCSTTTETTVGRIIFNKLLVERLGFQFVGFQNKPMTSSNYKKFEALITTALLNDVIDTKKFMEYIDTRDWFGLQVHGVITTSFTMKVIKTPKEVSDLKKKLLKENKEALAKGDYRVANTIETALIEKEMEVLKDDIGMDLYKSGARGSVGNNLKNINLIRGAVYNPFNNNYEVITNSLLEGLDKKDFAAHANAITNGAFPKAI